MCEGNSISSMKEIYLKFVRNHPGGINNGIPQQNKSGWNLIDDVASPISSVIPLHHSEIAPLSQSYVQEHALGHSLGFLFQYKQLYFSCMCLMSWDSQVC